MSGGKEKGKSTVMADRRSFTLYAVGRVISQQKLTSWCRMNVYVQESDHMEIGFAVALQEFGENGL